MQSRQKIAVIGLGGIGGVAAACLQQSGRHELVACARRPIDALTFDHGDSSVVLPLTTLTDPQAASAVHWIILCTKAQDSAAALPWFKVLCGPQTRIAVLQNGVNQAERIAPLCPGLPVLPAIVYYNGERLADDHVRLRHIVGHDLLAPAGVLAADFASLFEGTPISVGQSSDFVTFQWRKLLINVVANPITALTRQRLGIFRRTELQDFSLDVLREAVAVGRAEGARLADDEAEQVLATLLTYPIEAGTSMMFDCLNERPSEIHELTGAVVEAGRRHAIPTPLNGALLALLGSISAVNAEKQATKNPG